MNNLEYNFNDSLIGVETIDKIKAAMGDKKSKEIFTNLNEYFKTKDYTYLDLAISRCGRERNPIYRFYQSLKEESKKGRKIVLYGLGQDIEYLYMLQEKYRDSMGYVFHPFIDDISWNCFADKNSKKFQNGFHGRTVIGLEELSRYDKDAILVVGSSLYFEAIKDELISIGFSENNIMKYERGNHISAEENQYFDNEIMQPRKETTFIDGGSFNGDTITKFVEWNKDFGYEKVIGFEPNKVNFTQCTAQTKQYVNTLIVNEGLSNQRERISFYKDTADGAASRFDSHGTERISVTDIDSYFEQGPISFIKLDVEGFELDTLKGARKVIETYRPRLAVCVYHKEMDLFDCAQLLLKYHPDYQLYVRMYTNTYCETVLYAK